MKTKLFVSQSNYIPWRGFIDAINSVDEYIVYDDMQMSKNTYRNRNKIVGSGGPQWLSIPIKLKGRFGQKINQVEVVDDSWRKKHWKAMTLAYSKCEFFGLYQDELESLYLNSSATFLTEINAQFLGFVCRALKIKTKISDSRGFQLDGDRNERLVQLCRDVGAEVYCSSPTAKIYLDHSLFEQANIEVKYFDFSGYPEYDQGLKNFESSVSVLDVLFRFGPDSAKYIFKHS